MEKEVFGVKSIWTPKIFMIVYVLGGLSVFFLFYHSFFVEAIYAISVLLFLRVLYEFVMSSFKATEHLYRIAENSDKNQS